MWKSFWADIVDNYGAAWAFALACPLLFLIPVIVEFAQHVVEIQIGMYISREAASAVADDPSRMSWGFAKTLALILPTYWFTRYIIFGRDAVAARRIEWPAIAMWFGLFFYQAAVQYWVLFGTSFGELMGLQGQVSMVATGLFHFTLTILGVYLTAFFVALSLGNTALGPMTSLKIINGNFWRAIVYLLAAVIPAMLLHYALAYGAMGLPEWLVWIMMIVDAILVGFLALLPAGASAIAARFAAEKAGVSLLPSK